MAFRTQHKDLDRTLFDLAAVVAIASQRLASEGLTPRIHVLHGDFFHHPIPEGYDAILPANIVHNWLPEQKRKSAPVGGRLLLLDFWTDSTHTNPRLAALMAGTFLLSTGGDVYSEEEGRSWLAETGWQPPRPTASGAAGQPASG